MNEKVKNESVEKTDETELKKKKRELLTSKRVLKSGQQLLID